jgi:hypothetical protein
MRRGGNANGAGSTAIGEEASWEACRTRGVYWRVPVRFGGILDDNISAVHCVMCEYADRVTSLACSTLLGIPLVR